MILNYGITNIAYMFNGKDAFEVNERNMKIEEYESCNDYENECIPEEKDEGTVMYIGTALCAVDQFWAKAEDKVLQMVKRRVPTKTKKLLLGAIRESFNKLKFRLRDDLEEQGVNVTRYFDPFVEQKSRKLSDLKDILQRCDTTEASMDRYLELSQSAVSCAGSFTSLEGQMSSLLKVMSSTEFTSQPGSCPFAVTHMIPVLRGVKREVTTMLEFLESSRSKMSNISIREQSEESIPI
ncbi:hypothetical protein GE061_012442 [Apolygus lucorum]|uniref:Uncharacterized protein n=1 Tax=Apolygus lucorum TaxID=248454 RepID=A0A8S9XWE6_APOLU|nr:hypothetical protein GE061_012442 [Apolygus lucorum]